jgi:hypothetical protein
VVPRQTAQPDFYHGQKFDSANLSEKTKTIGVHIYFFVSFRIRILLAVITLGSVITFKTTIGDCIKATRKDFIKFKDEDWKHLIKPGSPTPASSSQC